VEEENSEKKNLKEESSDMDITNSQIPSRGEEVPSKNRDEDSEVQNISTW